MHHTYQHTHTYNIMETAALLKRHADCDEDDDDATK